MRLTVFDYGAGNLHSLVKAVAGDGREIRVETDSRRLHRATMVILPGVGSFPQAAERLTPARASLADAVRGGLPCLGICLGMQLLFEASDEGPGAGLGVLGGRVERLEARSVPHIGWNRVDEDGEPLLAAAGLDLAYFANSYACRTQDPACVVAWTTHEHDRFPAVVRTARTVGVQFHPEKSSRAGVRFLHAVLDQLTAASE